MREIQQQWGIKEMLANVLTQIRISNVFILWLYHLRAACSIDRFGCSQEQREYNKMRSFPFFAEQLPHLVLSIIVGFHALTGCNTMLPLSAKGKKTCWKMFIKHAHLLTGVVKDDNVDDASAFVCSLYGIGEKDVRGIDDARQSFSESET